MGHDPSTPHPALRRNSQLPEIPLTDDPKLLAVHMQYMRDALNQSIAAQDSALTLLKELHSDVKQLKKTPAADAELVKTKWDTLKSLGTPIATALSSAFLAWVTTFTMMSKAPSQDTKNASDPAPAVSPAGVMRSTTGDSGSSARAEARPR